MGNMSKLQNNYTPKNDEYYRKLYEGIKDTLNTENRFIYYTRKLKKRNSTLQKIYFEELKEKYSKQSDYVSSILSLVHEMDDWSPDDPEGTTYLGDNLSELWEKASTLQNNTLLDRWGKDEKYPPFIDIPETLTNLFKRII
jgi:hypothetical protein